MDKNYNNIYSHYSKMMDSNRLTGYLFVVIPFYFRIPKITMTILMSVLLFLITFIFSFGLIGTLISVIVFLIFSLEYNTVYNIRDEIEKECIIEQLIYEETLSDNNILLQPWENNYIDSDDIGDIFERILYDYIAKNRKSIRCRFTKLLK